MEKISIKIKGKSVPLDRFIVDALSLKNFHTKYEDSKKQTNKLIRELTKEEDVKFHPRNIERYILADLFPASVTKELCKEYNLKKDIHYDKRRC